MDKVGSLDSPRDLQPIRAKGFVNRFYLVLPIQTFNVMFLGVNFLNLTTGTPYNGK